MLYGRIPSKKNSKQWTGKYLISSKQYTYWEKQQIAYIKLLKLENEILDYDGPVSMSYKFYRPDNRKTDIENKISSVQDMFVKAGILKDDCWQIIRKISAESIGVDKENPRVEILIDKYSDESY